MRYVIFAALLVASSTASAECIGSGSLKTCYDDQGNTYDVQRLGDTTYVNGHNSRTGSRWSQESQRVGSSTFTNGRDADGNSWNSTSTRIGNSTITNGIDSDGNAFSQTCNEFGCY